MLKANHPLSSAQKQFLLGCCPLVSPKVKAKTSGCCCPPLQVLKNLVSSKELRDTLTRFIAIYSHKNGKIY